MPKLGNIIPLDLREYGKPPLPSEVAPFAQLEWIFDKRRDRMTNVSTKDNYASAKTFYIQHIELTEGRSPYVLAEKWDEFALLRFKGELQDRIGSGELSLTSYTLTGHFSAVRQVMKEAAAYGLLGTQHIQETTWGPAFSETDAHKCYSDKELPQILNAVAEELRYSYAVAGGYERQPENVGRDPRIGVRRGKESGYGYRVEANMRWYFENVLDCSPIVGKGKAKQKHGTFLAVATNVYGGLHELYRRWGVAAYVDENLLMPLAVNLQYLTGLNPSSLLGLKVDCLRDEHPLTGMPYLLFEKERSGGEKELHLPLLEKREERGLKRKQTLQVKRVVTAVLKLTERVRQKLAPGDPRAQYLFVYESTGPRTHGQAKVMNSQQTAAWCARMVMKYNLRNDADAPLAFNLVRFRSTKLTEMALEGRDLFEIQQVARHKSIAQTVRYIAAHKLDGQARKEISAALEQIRTNHEQWLAPPTRAAEAKLQPMHLFKGLIADCKNVFDPPEKVKRAVDYVPGQACTRFNMCLFCRNVVVLKEHLAPLAAYRAQILSAQANNVQNLPHGHLYDQTLSVLDNLLDPKVSQFTAEDIQLALEMSSSADIVVDPLLYRGACQ